MGQTLQVKVRSTDAQEPVQSFTVHGNATHSSTGSGYREVKDALSKLREPEGAF